MLSQLCMLQLLHSRAGHQLSGPHQTLQISLMSLRGPHSSGLAWKYEVPCEVLVRSSEASSSLAGSLTPGSGDARASLLRGQGTELSMPVLGAGGRCC